MAGAGDPSVGQLCQELRMLRVSRPRGPSSETAAANYLKGSGAHIAAGQQLPIEADFVTCSQ